MTLVRWAFRLVGAVMLGATAAIHLRLYTHDSYSKIPGNPSILKVGNLFIVNGVAASLLCLAVLGTPALLRWVALSGALLELGTLAALMISVHHGLFGFQDSSHAPLYHASIYVEIIGTVVLIALAALPQGPSDSLKGIGHRQSAAGSAA